MPSLLEIKNKISSTKSTKKITKAMQLVAASKMKTFQKTSIAVQAYATDLFQALQLSGTGLQEIVFAQERTVGKTMFILLTSDKGLCGAMNARLVRALFRSKEWKETPEDDRMLITVGRKASESARAEGAKPDHSFQGLKEQLEVVDALEVIDAIVTPWINEEVKQVYLVSPKYVNAFTFETPVRSYLPLSQERIEQSLKSRKQEGEELNSNTEAAFFEPQRDEVIESIAKSMVEALFVEAFLELKATEYSSRMVAMKNATEAADDRIKILTRLFNKARQNAITQELSELAAANEAMGSEDIYEINNV
ncbi:ATP synthase F1 subunit gamma [Candidatus Uhrbacteria bacterium]|jgi:F-type H+-transporting ATPase subunit gamma|nr:ATP synthase F1 subunit gamma [Candidatus Uhrbacteria bacterium]